MSEVDCCAYGTESLTICHAFFCCMEIMHIQISRSKSRFSRPWCNPLKRNCRSESSAPEMLAAADLIFRWSGSSAPRGCLGIFRSFDVASAEPLFQSACVTGP